MTPGRIWTMRQMKLIGAKMDVRTTARAPGLPGHQIMSPPWTPMSELSLQYKRL